jgi:hypothetical protein
MKYKREDFKNLCGMCTECKEMTSVVDPCCGGGVFFEGAFWSADDFDFDEE